MLRLTTVATILLAAVGCGTRTPERTEPTEPTAEPRDARVSFDLEDATVTESARTLSQVTGRPVVVAADARWLADCARVSVISPRPIASTAAPRLLTAALAHSGLALESTSDGWVIHRGPAEPPPECRNREGTAGPGRTIEAPTAAATATTTTTTTTTATDSVRDDQIRAGIHLRSETEVELTARAWDLLGDSWTSATARQARVIPHMVNGATVGLKLYGIRSTSLFAALGLHNGDVVLAVDGHPLTSPDQALEAYAGARGHDEVVASIERRGTRLEIHYRRRGH